MKNRYIFYLMLAIYHRMILNQIEQGTWFYVAVTAFSVFLLIAGIMAYAVESEKSYK